MLTITNTRTELTLPLTTMCFCLSHVLKQKRISILQPNSQSLIDNLAIDEPLMYAALALDCELQAWADAMDEDWSP